MLNDSYTEYIYQVSGETIKSRPNKIFESTGVYLIIDKDLKTIWVWAGVKSRLFHRYMASTWAGKLKSKQKFYNFVYEVIKEGSEPDDFHTIFNEISESRLDLKYPGESRTMQIKGKDPSLSKNLRTKMSKLSNSQKSQIKKIISEINEMQMHITYSMEHIGKRIAQIEKILEK